MTPIVVSHRDSDLVAERRARRWHVSYDGSTADSAFLHDALHELLAGTGGDAIVRLTLEILSRETAPSPAS